MVSYNQPRFLSLPPCPIVETFICKWTTITKTVFIIGSIWIEVGSRNTLRNILNSSAFSRCHPLFKKEFPFATFDSSTAFFIAGLIETSYTEIISTSIENRNGKIKGKGTKKNRYVLIIKLLLQCRRTCSSNEPA